MTNTKSRTNTTHNDAAAQHAEHENAAPVTGCRYCTGPESVTLDALRRAAVLIAALPHAHPVTLEALNAAIKIETARAKQPAPAPAVRFMLQDGMDWISYTAKPGDEATDGRKKFKEFHGRAPRKGFYLFMCHPDTKWDGCGGYTVPTSERGGWKPVRVL